MRITVIATAICLCLVSLAQADNAKASIRKPTNIPAESLGSALQTLAKDYDFQVLYRTEIVSDLKSQGAVGTLTSEEALGKVLSGTGLTYKYLDDRTVTIIAASGAGSAQSTTNGSSGSSDDANTNKEAGRKSSRDFRVAQVGQGKTTSDVPVDKWDEKTKNKKTEGLEEIVVTGTHIRGATDPVSPVQVYTREQVDRSGAGSVGEFLRKLPQNFGDVSENTIDGVAGISQSQNAVGGSGIDLRGLGSDATLVLIDGRRIAPGNFLGNFADVSLIPLSAIERIEVITDGASAIYGSDAVGGVINFILRRDFNGAETRIRYGTVNDGGHREFSAAQTVGRKWDGGSGLVSYEYSDGTPLSAADRSYSMTATQPFNLLPEQVRNSVIFTADQTISSGTAAFANGSFSHRSTYFDASLLDAFAQHNPADISAYGGTMGLRIDLFPQSQLELSGTYAASDTKLQTVEVPSEVIDFGSKTFATTWSFDAKLDGTLWATAAGVIRFAVGGQARHETFDYDQTAPNPFVINASRNIAAEYVELRIPIVAPRHSGTSEYSLELSLADRNEHYSDFGSSNNPEVGLLWRPIPDLKLHAVYGTSFKAPSLNDLHTPINDVFAAPNPDPLKSGTCNLFDPTMQVGCTNILLIGGGNPSLRAQKATTWSIGLDFQPQEVPTLRADANYYHIVFKDRIQNPSSDIVSINALASESFLGPSIIRRNPPPALLQGYLANPLLANPLNIDLSTIAVLVDSRVQNLSLVSTSGMDFSVSDEASTPFGQLATGLDATYILKFDNQFSSISPTVSLLNTTYNPINLKAKAHVALTDGPMNYAVLVNYVNSYKDNRSTVVVPIASWTTIDATIGYQVGQNAGVLRDASLMFAVTNIANKAPPFVSNEFFPVHFDGANANALGRFFSVQLSKRF